MIEHQLSDLLEGLGASDDHRDAIAHFTRAGISEATAKSVVAAIAMHRFLPAELKQATPIASIGAACEPINETQQAGISGVNERCSVCGAEVCAGHPLTPGVKESDRG